MDTTQLEKRIQELEREVELLKSNKPLLFTYLNTGTVTADKSLKIIVDGKQYQINVL